MIYTLRHTVYAVLASAPTLQPIPPASYTPPPYTLLSVTGAGAVSQITGLSQAHCLDEANVLLDGETLAEQADREAAERVAYIKRRDTWNATHPPHAPKTEEEKQAVADSKKGVWSMGGTGMTFHLVGHDIEHGADMVQDNLDENDGTSFGPSWFPDRGEFLGKDHGSSVQKGPTDIKQATCMQQ